MSIRDEIERTKSQIEEHRAAIANLEAHGMALALKSIGLAVGDRIIVEGSRGEYEAEVTGARYWAWSSPGPEAVKIKKDGTAGSVSAGNIGKWRKKGAAQ